MVAQATAILAGAVEPAEAFGSKRAVGAPAALAVENLAVAAPAVAAPAALAVAKRR